jgi:hypothetical protein
MITPPVASAALLAALLVPTAEAASALRGRLLYENFCYHCHITEIHYRVNSRVDSLGKLVHMVALWQEEMQLGWRAEDVADVTSYLNWVYYRFPDGGKQ